MSDPVWLITDKGDQDVRRLADRHYTRQTPGNIRFTRNGQNLVFITPDLMAGWVTFRPTPGKAVRPDGRDAWECALFRNEGPRRSSDLIREAVELSVALWGDIPRDGFLTYVDPAKVNSEIPGYCFIRAGWKRVGTDRRGEKPLFRARPPSGVRPWSAWAFREGRGGKLRAAIAPPRTQLAFTA